MAIGIANYPNITPANADYPNGQIKNDPSGTPVNVLTNGDIQIFFDKMLRIAGLTANGLPDNETNGYQLVDAVVRAARPYDVYTARITQAGSADPVASDIAENSIGAIVWTRVTDGVYLGTLTGAFANNTKVFISNVVGFMVLRAGRDNDDRVFIGSYDDTANAADGFTAELEIRVYR